MCFFFCSQEVDTRHWWQQDGDHVDRYRDSLTDEEVHKRLFAIQGQVV